MKKGFISIYVLIILLFISISLAFISKQAKNNREIAYDLYDKKNSSYAAESVINIFLDENEDSLINFIDKTYRGDFSNNIFNVDYDGKGNEVRIFYLDNKYKVGELRDTFRIKSTVYGEYTRSVSEVILKVDKNPILKDEIISYLDNKDSIDKLEFNTDSYVFEDFLVDKSIEDQFDGIIIVNKDLILEKDFNMKGILIVKGKIIDNNHKLNINGKLVLGNDSPNNVSFINDDKALELINLDTYLYTPRIIISRTY